MLEGALRGGIRVVQYRAKAGVDVGIVRRMRDRCAGIGGLLIVNDDADAALVADGLHAGQEDLERLGRGLRSKIGPLVLGISCGTPDEAVAAAALDADYIGVGPFAPTGNKSDAGPAIGVAGIRAAVAASPLPVVAIGGIGLENLAEVKASGARMAAVISALVRDGDPERSARALVQAWGPHRG